MTDTEELRLLPELLLAWYDTVKDDRALPWRGQQDPYRIWVSEIMLQQTRAETVKGYYRRFLEILPDVQALAQCSDDALRKLWEGLGYYNRAANLKKAAGVLCREYGGIFPKDHAAVRALPGIGDYTAGAICSIAWDMPTPAVDGNVLRVMARLTDDSRPIDRPEAKALASEMLAGIYPERAGDFTQALMELGATLCGPNRAPGCEGCPCRGICRSFRNGTEASLPVKLPKKERRTEERTVLILTCEDHFALRRRQDTGLLAGLWELPNLPGTLSVGQVLEYCAQSGLQVTDLYRTAKKKHIFTHIRWELTGHYLEVKEPAGDFSWLSEQELAAEAALPTAFRQFLDRQQSVPDTQSFV